jgi:hypothetical protein
MAPWLASWAVCHKPCPRDGIPASRSLLQMRRDGTQVRRAVSRSVAQAIPSIQPLLFARAAKTASATRSFSQNIGQHKLRLHHRRHNQLGHPIPAMQHNRPIG